MASSGDSLSLRTRRTSVISPSVASPSGCSVVGEGAAMGHPEMVEQLVKAVLEAIVG